MEGATRKMDCEGAERRLHGYLDRELSEHQAEELSRHLQACDNCRARFRFEEGLRRLVYRAGSDDSAPEGLRERIQQMRHSEHRR